MKRTIIIETMCLFVSAILIVLSVLSWIELSERILSYNNLIANGYIEYANDFRPVITQNITCSILSSFATIVNLAVMLIIAIKDFPVFKPILDNLNERKQKHAQAKAERAEETKQAKIAELEKQLEELKKDE